MASAEVRGCSAFASALVVVALFLPFATVTSCGERAEKTSTTGVSLIRGRARPPAPTGARPYVAAMAALAAGGLGLALVAARWAALARVVVALVGGLVTGLTSVVVWIETLTAAAAVGPGWWLALFGFALAVLVEVVDLIATR